MQPDDGPLVVGPVLGGVALNGHRQGVDRPVSNRDEEIAVPIESQPGAVVAAAAGPRFGFEDLFQIHQPTAFQPGPHHRRCALAEILVRL